MATNLRAPLTQDLWHLSIDDLLAPLPEKPRLGGVGPFVINLSSSTAGIGLPASHFAGCESSYAYEIQRTEDGRTRYRLRLGPFDSEEEADAIIGMVREVYPSALTATAGPDDLKVIAAIRAKAAATLEARRGASRDMTAAAVPAKNAPVAAPAAAPATAAKSAPVPAPVPATATPPVLPVSSAVSSLPKGALELSLAPEPPRTPVTPAPAASTPATPVVAPAMRTARAPGTSAGPSMSISAPLVNRRATAAPVQSPKKTAAPIVKAPVAAPAPPRPVARAEQHLSIDSTQTIRALTPVELQAEGSRPWFVIQLAQAPEPFDPDSVPNLDIFSVYRLYCVADIEGNQILHSLRVGFFSEEIAAKAVASYLGEYYDKPAIKRVSVAERERFADQQIEARKDVGATGRHAVIEITDDLIARRKHAIIYTATT
jgi:SPOR domain